MDYGAKGRGLIDASLFEKSGLISHQATALLTIPLPLTGQSRMEIDAAPIANLARGIQLSSGFLLVHTLSAAQ